MQNNSNPVTPLVTLPVPPTHRTISHDLTEMKRVPHVENHTLTIPVSLHEIANFRAKQKEAELISGTETRAEHTILHSCRVTKDLTLNLRFDYGTVKDWSCVPERVGILWKFENSSEIQSVFSHCTVHVRMEGCNFNPIGPKPIGYPSYWGNTNMLPFSQIMRHASKTTGELDVNLDVKLTLVGSKRQLERALNPNTKRRRVTNLGLNMFERKTGSDFIIKIGEQSIKCHKCVLMMNSPYFASLFENTEFLYIEQTENTLIIEDFDFQTMNELVRYMYTHELSTNSQDNDVESNGKTEIGAFVDFDYEALFRAAEKYRMTKMCDAIMDVIMSQSKINPLVLISGFRLVFLYGDFPWFHKYERDIFGGIRNNFEALKRSAEFRALLEKHGFSVDYFKF